jgi:phenylacetate-coenzyme A ligase PaaK-like adenylate-forming protein
MSGSLAVAAFRDRLIGETVAGAARETAFYSELYRGVDLAAVQTTEALQLLPTVDKATLAAAGASALSATDTGAVVALQNTSGTTGAPFFVYRCEAEQDFLRAFFAEWAELDEAVAGDLPLVLTMANDRHGTPTGVPARAFPIGCRLIDRTALLKAEQMLGVTFAMPGVESRISAIAGAHDDIIMLTAHLMERGVEASSAFAVRQISPVGRYLTDRWRELLSTVWGARVCDRYSLAEAFGGATWSPERGAYAFDPYLIPEVLQLADGAPAADGVIGRLHVTTPRPFGVMQPLIRYRTGDLFSRIREPSGAEFHNFYGREAHALFCPNDPSRLLLTGPDVLNVLDPHPEFERDRYSVDLGLADPQAAGWPRSRGAVIEGGASLRLRLDVETRACARLYARRAATLADDIREGLMARAPELRTRIEEGEAELEVRFATPGSLAPMERTSRYWRAE